MRLWAAALTLSPIFLCQVAEADNVPRLSETNLYKTVAHDCRAVRLATWQHPTKKVLLKNKVRLDALELCNKDVYPIYHVAFRYDPESANTNDFFLPLYVDMIRANGHHPFAFVDSSFNWITYIREDHGVVSETSDIFKP
jgi:hypothetical protein